MQASFAIFVSVMVSVLVLFDLVSLGLTTALVTNASPDQTLIAFFCGTVTMGVSFTILLFITLPACICSLRKREDKDNKDDCCTPTYFVSVIVAGTISVIGAFITGFTQIFAAYIYKDVQEDASLFSLIRGAAAFNFIAALFGTWVIFSTMCACLSKHQNWQYCRECPSCRNGAVVAFIIVTALVIAILVASLPTMFMSFYTTNYSDENGESPNYIRATVATFFSCGAAGCLLVGLCIGGPILCCMRCQSRREIMRITSIVMGVWGLLAAGTVVSGGLMMKVGQSFASEETLNPDERVNRGPISAQAYFYGALNFVALLIAILLCCCGIFFWNYKKLHKEEMVVAEITIETEYIVTGELQNIET